jgi:hypothetical protein
MLLQNFLGLSYPLGFMALLAGIAVLYLKTRRIELLLAGSSVVVLLVLALWGLLQPPRVLFDEGGEMVSGSMPPDWLIWFQIVSERVAYVVLGFSVLVFSLCTTLKRDKTTKAIPGDDTGHESDDSQGKR